MTQFSRACYFARRAADLCRYNGITTPGFARLPAARHGAIWQFCHDESGLVILLNASGAVNAKATKEAREEAAAADLARLVSSAKEARDMAREVDSALAALDTAPAPRAPLPAFCAALAPVTPALESPLLPLSRGAARVALALARGHDVAALMAPPAFGPRARVMSGAF